MFIYYTHLCSNFKFLVFDTSEYPKEHILYTEENKKVLGKMKDEWKQVKIKVKLKIKIKMKIEIKMKIKSENKNKNKNRNKNEK